MKTSQTQMLELEKNRNIRDNIFVVNAILNSIEKLNLKDTDVALNDVKKCFEKLWAKESL